MSPPIRDGSGNDIGSIRLGDGSEISEVRTGGGDVLFSAIPDSVVDHFEPSLYEDIGNTLSDYYVGDLTSFSRQQTTVESGSFALKSTAEASIGAGSAPNASPKEGDTFECHVYVVGNDDGGVAWGASGPVGPASSGDGYEIDLNTKNKLTLRKWDGGNNTELAGSNPSVPSDEWLRAEITWQADGSMSVLVEDGDGTAIDTLTATDNTYENNTGISFRNGGAGSNSVFFDGYRIL